MSKQTLGITIDFAEAAVRRRSSVYVLLKIWQYSQESTCVGICFDKVGGLSIKRQKPEGMERPLTLLKRESNEGVFL